jgi:probable DNA metabolism protein
MGEWKPVCYHYDGSFAGLLTCMDESFCHFEEPVGIYTPEDHQLSLYPPRPIPTDPDRARRFYRSIKATATREAQRLVSHAYLTSLPERERAIWRFLDFARQRGQGVMYWRSDERVATLMKAVHALYTEAHRLKSGARFSDCQGLLWSEIRPENRVLPLLRPHFCQRFQGETLLIYDSVHGQALVYSRDKWRICPAEPILFPAEDATEEDIQRLWARFDDLYHPRVKAR